jgi:hypothetical protein
LFYPKKAVFLRKFKKHLIMAVTQLYRKTRRNFTRANNATTVMKQLLRRPTIKKVDVEAIKASFAAKS